MTLAQTQCVVMACAGCGDSYADPETECEAHFTSAAEAMTTIAADAEAGWLLADGGWDARCRDCAAEPGRRLPVRAGVCVVYCVTLACNRCGQELGDGAHWGDAVEAYRTARSCDWATTGDRVVCVQCVAELGCELLDHAWGEWHPVTTAYYLGWNRICGECCRSEYDPPLPPLPCREVAP